MNVVILSFQANTDIISAKYIHAFLQINGFNSSLILQTNPRPESDTAILDFIAENHIHVVGISLMSGEYFRASRFAARFRERFPDMPLIFGGIHATIAPDECLIYGDVAVRGEGEHTLLDLLHHIRDGRDYRDIPGICIKENDGTRINPPRPLEPDINIFPFPRHLPKDMYVVTRNRVLPMDIRRFRRFSRYNGLFPNIMTTRGCPFSCTYCCNAAYKKLYGHYPVRKRSVESVIAECEDMITQHADSLSLNVQDDCFLTYSDEWFASFVEQYKQRIGLPFVIRTTPLHITEQKLTMLKEAGLIMVMMGLQSGSDRINREVYKRNVSNETFIQATRIVRKLGLGAYYDVMLDNPYETEQDVLETLNVVLQIPKPYQFQLFSLCFFQGTELHERALREGVAFVDPRVDDFGRLAPTPVNKLIRLVPTFPVSFVEYLRDNRHRVHAKILVNLLLFIDGLLLTPASFMALMHRSYGSRLTTTLKLLRYFSKTAIREMMASTIGQQNM